MSGRRSRSPHGTRKIGGKFYLLAGRTGSKQWAESEAAEIRRRGNLVRIVKLSEWDFMIYAFPKD